MKKNVLALSIAAAVVGFGFAGSAQAVTGALAGATANDLRISPNGVGHMLLVPYYTAQAENATLINLVNTDTANGKAVKVRFRSASNSDDVYDFQLFMSPGDVWGASVTQGTDGRATLATNDSSCTKPAKSNLGSGFVTNRLDSTFTAAQKANATREGYVEIFNMADIVPGSDLFGEIKHVNSKVNCGTVAGAGQTAWTALDRDAASWAGLTNPTSGLMGNFTIVNLATAAAYGGAATAIVAVNGIDTTEQAKGNLVYWPQTPVSATNLINYTADPLFTVNVGTSTTPPIAASLYDLPDMSTPYTTAIGGPKTQAAQLSQSIATTSVKNEFLTDPAIAGVTDWVFSMPTRRYSVAFDYASGTRVYSALPTPFFTSENTTVTNRQICVTGITYSPYDREENTPVDASLVVISPNDPATPTAFCGEASVLSVNNGGAAASGVLKANVALKDIDTSYKEGWINITTPGINNGGLPILGDAYVRAIAGSSQFGVNWAHRFSRRGL